jgi:anthranilate synthase component 2
MILLIDNYDSFVYNLDRYLQRLGQQTIVVRSDAMTVDAITRLNAKAIVISPGPKSPDDAGCSMEVIRRLGSSTPILGVCLGHQSIGQAYGGKIVRASEPIHGKASSIEHDGTGLFEGIPNPFVVGRYHSLIVDRPSLPSCLRPTAWTPEGTIMALAHIEHPVAGVQFHPESILTEHGYRLLANFLAMHQIPHGSLPLDDLRTLDG